MEGLALKMRQHFPILQGLVLKVEDKKVFLDLGRQQVKKHMKLLVFREGEAIRHPITGKLLGAPTEILGEVEIESALDDFSQGVLLPTDKAADIKQLDKVITK